MEKNHFYVTTPIYYGTAKPHLGSLYSTLIADVIDRWHRLKGEDTYFLTGTDEHGQKILQAAQKANMSPKKFVDSFIAAYQEAWNTYSIDYDQFIRTTDPHHIKGVQDLIKKLLDQGDIYKGTYKGWYCTPCETFITEAREGSTACPSCGRPTDEVAEESYFFKLSAYEDKLLKFYNDNPQFIVPHERANEVLSFVQAGLKDLSISRTTISWGVPFPNDPEHVVYVWVDALCNYITAIGYGDSKRKAELARWWPANVQVLGKDIIRFHAVYWPAMLMAAGLEAPKQLLVHGWIKVNAQKMSKSLGNVVDPMELAQTYGAEQIRYYLIRHIAVNQDGDFNIVDLEQTINADLANSLGNLLNRMVSVAHKREVHTIAPIKKWSPTSLALRDAADKTVEEYENHMAAHEFHLALARLWKFIHEVNRYFHDQEPWKVKEHEQFVEIMSATCHSLRTIAVLLWPILPGKMSELLASIGHDFDVQKDSLKSLELSTWHEAFTLKKIDLLFKKIEPQEPMVSEQEQKQDVLDTSISIDDLMKVEMRVGEIKEAESVPQSDKLIKMQVDFGEHGKRQILAGIRKSILPEDLVGKKTVFAFNLKPRKMMGMESQGMLLVAKDAADKVHLTLIDGDVPNGTRLQ